MARTAPGRLIGRRLLAAALAWASAPAAGLQEKSEGDRPFEGLRALVIQPENFWGWDSAVFGALEERGFETDYGPPERLERPEELARYHLVAANIRRTFTPAQVQALMEFVDKGGAFYGSWGGPMGTPALLSFCRVRRAASVRIPEMTLVGNTPFSVGIGEKRILFPRRIGHSTSDRWELVSLEPLEGGHPVARDPEGRVLGVLSRAGSGRTAVLGFGPEREKQFAEWPLGPILMNNLLRWLLESRLSAPPPPTGRLTVALPARTEELRLRVNGRETPLRSRSVGSLLRLELDLRDLQEGQSAAITLSYKPLAPARNVETMIHLPWDTLPSAASSPAGLADYLASLRCTIVQPLLRSGDGTAWYRGLPEDRSDDRLVKNYRGDFLRDLIEECHRRGIQLIGGIYFSHTIVRRDPSAARIGRTGQTVHDAYGRPQTCFHRPQGQEYNLETVRHLVSQYAVDGIILDDNFELDQEECFCSFCKEAFRNYCLRQNLSFEDPASLSTGPLREHWMEHRREATRELAARVARIAHDRGRPAGGWVGASLKATHLASCFDFLGGMVYTDSPRAARLPLSVLGKHRFICLLWAPDVPPDLMEHEARQAIHAGAPVIGFWTRNAAGDCRYRMDEARAVSIRRAFEGAESEWLRFYRDNILSGDPRFVLTGGRVGRQEALLTVKNLGRKGSRRLQGPLDLSALE